MRDTDRGRRSERFATIWNGMTAEDAAALAPDLFASEAGSPFQNDWLEFLQLWGRLDPARRPRIYQGKCRVADRRLASRHRPRLGHSRSSRRRGLVAHRSDHRSRGHRQHHRQHLDQRRLESGGRVGHLPRGTRRTTRPGQCHRVSNRPKPTRHRKSARRGLPRARHPPTALEISLFNNFAREMPIDWLSQVKELFPVPPILLERLAKEMPTPAQGIETPDPRAKEWFLCWSNRETGPVLEHPDSLEILKPVRPAFPALGCRRPGRRQPLAGGPGDHPAPRQVCPHPDQLDDERGPGRRATVAGLALRGISKRLLPQWTNDSPTPHRRRALRRS